MCCIHIHDTTQPAHCKIAPPGDHTNLTLGGSTKVFSLEDILRHTLRRSLRPRYTSGFFSTIHRCIRFVVSSLRDAVPVREQEPRAGSGVKGCKGYKCWVRRSCLWCNGPPIDSVSWAVPSCRFCRPWGLSFIGAHERRLQAMRRPQGTVKCSKHVEQGLQVNRCRGLL